MLPVLKIMTLVFHSVPEETKLKKFVLPVCRPNEVDVDLLS